MAYAALAIGALVPASIMSIGAANLFTRSIYRQYIRPDATASQETRVSRTASLLVKLGAIAVILLVTPQFAIDLQLMGGVITLACHMLGISAGVDSTHPDDYTADEEDEDDSAIQRAQLVDGLPRYQAKHAR